MELFGALNDWKLLLTVIQLSFMLNMTGFLDPTLKYIDKFRLRQWSIASAIYMFKVSKKTLEQPVKYI